MRLKDDVALVTGGGSGIGRATCIRLAEEGATVAVLDLNLEPARATVQEIESAGGRALAVKADVSRAQEVEAAVAEVVAAFEALYDRVGPAHFHELADPIDPLRDIMATAQPSALLVE